MELGTRKKEPDTPLAVRLSVWLFFLILVAFFYLGKHPILIENEPIPFKPYEIKRSINADVIVVVDYAAIRRSNGLFPRKDWSAAWIDTFEQAIGPISVATPETLTLEMITSCRWLVLTHSATQAMPAPLVDNIRDRVRAGMFLTLERPTGRLRETFSADGEGTEREPSAVTYASELPQPYAAHLENSPLLGTYVTSRGARERSVTHLAFDGAPVVYVSKFGEGYAMTVDFDFGQWLVGIQQGTPNDDFSVSVKDSMREGRLSADLVHSSKLDGSDVPYADLMEHFLIWRVAATHVPIAAIWPFPDAKKTVVLLTHPDSNVGAEAAWIAKFENERDASSTFLKSWDVAEPSSFDAFKGTEHEAGFLWRMSGTPDEQTETLGIGGWEPLSRPVGLTKQFEAVKNGASGGISTAQIMGGRWGDTWDGPFRDLAISNVRIDTSYGVPKTNGFSFGTGFPFLVMSREGVPIGLRELPIVAHHGALRGPNFDELLEIATVYHVPITYQMPVDWFSKKPDPSDFRAWSDRLLVLPAQDIAVTDVRTFDVFSRARRVSGLRSKFNPDAKLPWLPRKASEGLRGDPIETAAMIRVSAQAKIGGMSVVVPEQFQGKYVFTVREKARSIEQELVAAEIDSTVQTLIGIPLRVIPIERGFSTVDVYYR